VGVDYTFGHHGALPIFGGAGNDQLSGGSGRDRIFGDDGHDILFGEADDDFLSGGSGDDAIFGGAGNDVLYGGVGADTITDGAGRDVVLAGEGDDLVVAALDAAHDSYSGNAGHDTLDYSAAGEALMIDLSNGTAQGTEIGHDVISGFEAVLSGAGDDHFRFGGQSVFLEGGTGANIFEFMSSHADTMSDDSIYRILDFKVGDLVRMARYDIYKNGEADRDDDEWIYGSPASQAESPIRYRIEIGDEEDWTKIEADLDDDDLFEMAVLLYGRHELTVVEWA